MCANVLVVVVVRVYTFVAAVVVVVVVVLHPAIEASKIIRKHLVGIENFL